MMRQSYTAVVERDQAWSGACATEPYEAAWASEAIFFIRVLDGKSPAPNIKAHVQVSPDGMNWCDEGTRVAFPKRAQGVTFCRVKHFGGWLRLAANLPKGVQLKVIVYVVVKE